MLSVIIHVKLIVEPLWIYKLGPSGIWALDTKEKDKKQNYMISRLDVVQLRFYGMKTQYWMNSDLLFLLND